jgi:hypothetical protein
MSFLSARIRFHFRRPLSPCCSLVASLSRCFKMPNLKRDDDVVFVSKFEVLFQMTHLFLLNADGQPLKVHADVTNLEGSDDVISASGNEVLLPAVS